MNTKFKRSFFTTNHLFNLPYTLFPLTAGLDTFNTRQATCFKKQNYEN